MQAIITKYLGPTNTKGSRIKATCAAGSLTRSYDNGLDSDGNHRAVAEALCVKMGWVSTPNNLYTSLCQGQLPNGDNVFTFIPAEYEKAMLAVFETRLAISKGENNGNPHGRPWGKAITYLTDDNGSCQEAFRAWVTGNRVAELEEQKRNTCGNTKRQAIQDQIDAIKAQE
jgi:hypothetical protein